MISPGVVLFVIVGILVIGVYILLCRMHPSPSEMREMSKDNFLDPNDTRYTTKFRDNELFCKECYCHDHYFVGGGSWAPDWCPFCKGTACINWKDVPLSKREFASELFDKMWKWCMTGPNGGSNPRSFPRGNKVAGFEQYYR